MRNSSLNPFYSTPVAILVGSLIISFAVLVHGGFIKLGGIKTTQPTAQASTAPVAQPTQTPVTLTQIKDVFSKSFIKFGDTNKKLIVIEIADPSCPFCHVVAGLNKELNKQIGSRFTLVADGGTYVAPIAEVRKLVNDGKVSFAYIYTPGHGNGEMGTKALYCAFEKGKFWEVHDILMTQAGYDLLNDTVKNDKGKSGDLASFLQSAIDSSFMKQCLDSGKYDSRLNQDVALASGIGVSGTPGFYFNTTQFPGAYNYSDMQSVVKTALGI